MGNDYYEEKTYKSFIILIITMFLVPFLLIGIVAPLLGDKVALKLVLIYISAVIIFIAYIIYKKERVYWITSYSYKDACNMTSKERGRIGLKFLKASLTCFGILILYLFIGIFLNISYLIDIVVFSIACILFCIKS